MNFSLISLILMLTVPSKEASQELNELRDFNQFISRRYNEFEQAADDLDISYSYLYLGLYDKYSYRDLIIDLLGMFKTTKFTVTVEDSEDDFKATISTKIGKELVVSSGDKEYPEIHSIIKKVNSFLTEDLKEDRKIYLWILEEESPVAFVCEEEVLLTFHKKGGYNPDYDEFKIQKKSIDLIRNMKVNVSFNHYNLLSKVENKMLNHLNSNKYNLTCKSVSLDQFGLFVDKPRNVIHLIFNSKSVGRLKLLGDDKGYFMGQGFMLIFLKEILSSRNDFSVDYYSVMKRKVDEISNEDVLERLEAIL